MTLKTETMTTTVAWTAAVAFAAIGLLNAPVAMAAPEPSNGAQFLRAAMQIDIATMQDGELAQARSKNPAIKDFGKTLVADDTQAKANAMAVAHSMQVSVQVAPDKAARAEYQRLDRLSGATFDKAFVNEMVAGQKQAISAFQVESKTGDTQVAELTKNELPMLQKQLDTAQSLLPKTGSTH